MSSAINMAPKRVPSYIRHLNEIMYFTSQVIGRNVGIGVHCPYLAPAVRQFALSLAQTILFATTADE